MEAAAEGRRSGTFRTGAAMRRFDLQEGSALLDAWLASRFPDASVTYAGATEAEFHRWTVRFGATGAQLRIGVPEHVLKSEPLLSRRMRDLETGGWLSVSGGESRSVMLLAVGVASRLSAS